MSIQPRQRPLKIAPDIRTGLYLSNSVQARHGEPKHHLKHRLAEGIYA